MRRRYFLGKGPQLKYLGLLIVSMTLPTILVGAGLYFLIFRIVETKATQTEFISQCLLPAIDRINLNIMICLPVIFVLMCLWGLFLSHRFSGPIVRLNKELKEISTQGDFSKRLMVRRHDDLKSLVVSINEVLEKAQKKAQ